MTIRSIRVPHPLALAFAAILLFVLAPKPAFATYPGVNGRIAYTDLIDVGTTTARRAVFSSPGGQLTHPPTRSVTSGNTTSFFNENDSDPAWSPDGKSLAFIRQGWNGTTQKYAIYVLTVATGELRLAADALDGLGNPTFLNGKRISSLSWSPDGQRIGFLSQQGNFIPGIYSVKADFAAVPSFSSHVPQPFSASSISGFEWAAPGFLYPCTTFWTGPRVLFCTSTNDGFPNTINAIGEDQGPMSAGFLSGLPRWQPNGLNGQKVLFALGYSTDPAQANATFRTEVFSLNASSYAANGDYIGSGLVRQAKNDGVLTCVNTNPTTHVTTTTYSPQYQFSHPVPSPDGRFFVVRRTETQTTTIAGGGCGFKSVGAGLYLYRNNGGMQSIVALGLNVDDAAWQPDPANLAVTITDGHGAPLDDLRVGLYDFQTKAPIAIPVERKPGGTYTFPDVPPGQYRIRATLTDEVGHAFDVRDSYPASEPVWAERKVTIAPDVLQVEADFPITDSPEIVDSNVFPIVRDRLDDFAAIYFQTLEFVKWVRINLTTNTGAPVPIHAFATQSPDPSQTAESIGSAYYPISGVIVLGETDSDYASRDDDRDPFPLNGEWHEFSHHLSHQFIAPFSCPGVNHHGYENPSTCDSFQEGFATFLPTQVRNDPHYADIVDLEDHVKPWNYRYQVLPFGLFSTEDLAVAALLWDLTDSASDFESTLAITHGGVHLPTVYIDATDLALIDLWTLLTTQHPTTVVELQDAFRADNRYRNITVDVDHDLVLDVSAVDSIFLMHGFFPIVNDQTLTATHGTYHYDVNSARINTSIEPDINVGYTGHTEYFFQTGLPRAVLHPRSKLTPVANADVVIQVLDASGTPLQTGQLELTIQYPGAQSVVRRNLGAGDGVPVHLELPTYFDYLLPVGAPLPACNPATDRVVNVAVRAIVNGYASTNTESFDNCEYLQAMAAAPGSAPLAFSMQFPEDSTAPVSTAERRSVSPIFGDYTVGTWTVDLTCADPVAGNFASGCQRIEYSLDGAPFVAYAKGIDVTTPGLHRLDYRSVDGAGNQEGLRTLNLGISGANERIPPVTTATAVPSVPDVNGATTGTWTVSLTCDDSNGGNGGAGCLRTEYGINGGAFVTYGAPIVLSQPGVYTLRYRSIDVLNNTEATRSLTLIVMGPDTTPPYTFLSAIADGAQSPYYDGVMGPWILHLEFCSDETFRPPDQVASGCDRTEYNLDGGPFQPFTADVLVESIGLHSFGYRSIDVAGNVESVRTFSFEIVAASDVDQDGVLDYADNCHLVANADQADWDEDQLGNRCDPDFNQNGVVDSNDGSLLKANLGTPAAAMPVLDLDGSGALDAADMSILKSMFRKQPGPAYGYDPATASD